MPVPFIEWVWVILYWVYQENCWKVPKTKDVSTHIYNSEVAGVWLTHSFVCNLQVCYIRLHMLNILNGIIFAGNKHLTPPQNTGSQEPISDRQWPEVSDFVARFCTLQESENTRTCMSVCFLTLHVCVLSDSCNVQKCAAQIIYLGPLPNLSQ